MTSPFADRVRIDEIAGPVGVRVAGLDLALLPQLTRLDATATMLRGALAARGVLIFDGPVGADPQVLSLLAGLLADAPDDSDDRAHVQRVEVGPAELVDLRRWQTTGSYRAHPPICTVATALRVPTRGGQFQFADMRKAVELLPDADLTQMRPLRLVHRADRLEPDSVNADSDAEHAEHAWVRTAHDGRESLFMGAGASHIVGRDVAESRRWFAEIEAQLPVHDVFLEHRWQPGDLLAWDHRIVLHRMLGFDAAAERAVFDLVTR